MSPELYPSAACLFLAVVVLLARRTPGRWLDALLGGLGIGGIDARASAAFLLVALAATYAMSIRLLAEYSRLPDYARYADAAAISIIASLLTLWLLSRLRRRGSGLGD